MLELEVADLDWGEELVGSGHDFGFLVSIRFVWFVSVVSCFANRCMCALFEMSELYDGQFCPMENCRKFKWKIQMLKGYNGLYSSNGHESTPLLLYLSLVSIEKLFLLHVPR
mgnify:CR=1 FL=1